MYPISSQLLTYYCEYTNLVNVVFSLSPHLLMEIKSLNFD